MTFLNEYEAADAQRLFDQEDVPNLQRAADIVSHLIDWTNSCSDGWPYWQKPRRAADKLCVLIEDKRRELLYGHYILDIEEKELTEALRPIKSFLTKQGVDYHGELPWAAILPAA
jgi:hypothetical protein